MNFTSNSQDRKISQFAGRRGYVLLVLLVGAALVGLLASGAQAASTVKSKLTLVAPTKVTSGKTFSVSGTLHAAKGGQDLAGRRITLYWEEAGSKDFERFESAKTNNWRGGYTMSMSLTEAGGGAGKLLARFAGEDGLAESSIESPRVTIVDRSGTSPKSKAGSTSDSKSTPKGKGTTKPKSAGTTGPTLTTGAAPGAGVSLTSGSTAPPTSTSTSPAPTAAFPIDPLAAGENLIPVQNATFGIVPGQETCGGPHGNEIAVTQPSISAPTGTFVYAIDKLYARPEESTTYQLAATGEQFYSAGTKAVNSWVNLRTGQTDLGSDLDSWAINPGYAVHVAQFIWVNNVWYYQNYNYCQF